MLSNSCGEVENGVIVSVMTDECNGDEGGGSVETKKAVPVSEFETFVSEYHDHENKKFYQAYQVC